MPAPAEMNAIGGVWPLGQITMPGSPISILLNVGGTPAQRAASGLPVNPYTPSCRQLLFSTTGNAAIVYLMDGNYPITETNRIVATFGPNFPYSAFPWTALTESVLDLSRYYLVGT